MTASDIKDVEEGIPIQGEDGRQYVVLEVLSGSDSLLERCRVLLYSYSIGVEN